MTKLEELGHVVAREQDVAYARRRRDERSVERFVSSVAAEPARSRQRIALAMGACAAAAALLLGLVHWTKLLSSDEHAHGLAAGQHVIARAGQSAPLDFPDGSRVVLSSDTEAIVHELGESSAKLEVSRGEASVVVRHQKNTKWVIGAGPYRVRVTGTRFSVAWTPERERFELRLEQGSVVVSADTSSHAAVTMLAPETLVIDRTGWQLSPPERAALSPAPEPAAPLPSLAAEAPPPAPEAFTSDTAGSVAAVEPASPAAPAASSPSWEALVRSGKYPLAYAEASRLGVMQLANTRPASALLSLAEACRFSSHSSEATQVLTRLRARFPGTDEAATAAFQLGRFSGDAGAVVWFRAYLQERPRGAFAREAAGRLLEALSRSGDRAGAARAAEAYLASYPSGTHAEFARKLLDK